MISSLVQKDHLRVQVLGQTKRSANDLAGNTELTVGTHGGSRIGVLCGIRDMADGTCSKGWLSTPAKLNIMTEHGPPVYVFDLGWTLDATCAGRF